MTRTRKKKREKNLRINYLINREEIDMEVFSDEINLRSVTNVLLHYHYLFEFESYLIQV
jgi:hypothetical protein